MPSTACKESLKLTNEGLREEVESYLEGRVVRRRLLPRALLVGLASGVVAVLFRMALQAAETLRQDAIDLLPQELWLRAGVAGVLAALGTYVALRIGKLDRDAGGSGIPHMKAVLEGHSTMVWYRLILVKFAAAVTAIGTGLALGREGPTVQMGGATGMAISDATGATGREKRALMAAGSGAGLAGAFNAPLAGVTFVLEEMQRDFQPVVFVAALMAAAVATVVSRVASGQFPVFTVPPIATPSLIYLPLFAVIGVAAGGLGVAFNKCLLGSGAMMGEWRKANRWTVPLVVGAGVAIAFACSPSLLGGGHPLSELALMGKLGLGTAVAYLVVRFALVHVSYGSGVPGGIFAPLLSLGAVLGVLILSLTHAAFPGLAVGAAACAVAGMSALFSSVVRAPLTGVILIAEMTGSYDMLLPLLVASFGAYAVAELLGDTPIYEALLQRDAIRKGWDLLEGDPTTAEVEVAPGSAYAGKTLRDVNMPSGALVVVCRSRGQEFVPTADTILTPGMRIVLAAASPHLLREAVAGCRAS